MDYSKLKISLSCLCITVTLGTLGYVVFEDMTLFDAFYMVIITISTVGFSEIKPLSETGRAMTLMIIVSGISLLTYSLSQVAKIVVEGELREILGRRKLEKLIAELRNHYIICGYGRIGQIIVNELKVSGMPLVVIEQDPEMGEQLENDGVLYLIMDATSDDALEMAGVEHARGLVTAVRSDADNVFISLSAKGIRPDIFILARASDSKNERKLLRAGASRVVCPYEMGGRRMAEILHKPTVVDFLDEAMMNGELGLQMEEATIAERSWLAGKTVEGSRLISDYGVIIVAINRQGGEMVFNPDPAEVFLAGDVIVLIGKRAELLRMNEAIR